MLIQDIMAQHVRTCAPGDSLERAAQVMWEGDCGSLPVVDRGKVVGMITDRDICMAAYTQGCSLRGAIVASAMSRDVWSCRPDDPISEAEELMQSRQLRRLPVIDEDGSLVGFITTGDLLRAANASTWTKATTMPGIVKTLNAVYQPRSLSVAAE